MPELPEVETVCRGLGRHLPGRRLRRVGLRRTDLRWPIPVAAFRALRDRRCDQVRRRSKYLQLAFSGPDAPVVLVHLGMSGRLWVDVLEPRGRRPSWNLHEHWRMDFGDRLVRFSDPRRFGMLDVVPGAAMAQHRLLRHLGPEPLQGSFNGTSLHQSCRRRRLSVKNFLMDSRNVVGIGNIYASEACFRGGVRPGRAAGRLTRTECDRLARAVKHVLRAAIRAGGTTLRDYVGVDEKAGLFQRKLHVYGRHDEPCHRCGTGIKRVAANGRSTYYCPACQR